MIHVCNVHLSGCLSTSSALQSALWSGQEARIVQKLCSMGIEGSVMSILTQFLTNRSQHVMVVSCRSYLVNVVSGVPQGSGLGPLFCLLHTSELFSIFPFFPE